MGGHGGGFSIAQTRRGADDERLIGIASPDPIARLPGLSEDPLQARILAIPKRPTAPVAVAGFRHFLSDADTLPLEKQFKVDGDDPLRSHASIKRLRELMARLAKRMRKTPVWEGDEGDHENPDIPAGYTYLLQLVAHDLVETTYPLSILEDTTTGVRNDRAYRLKLDTIYGGGPQVCPFAYATEPRGVRSRLRLGGGNKEDQVEMMPKARDVARFDGGEGDTSSGLTDPLIADPRNDDHAILSQLTALVHHLHNGLMDRLAPPLQMDTADSDIEATFDAFLCARGAAVLIYRNVIRRDLMKRVLQREIYNRYDADRPDFLDDFSVQPRNETGASRGSPHRGSLVPLEFTHGAFRFGHAMVRKSYKINPAHDAFELNLVLRATSSSDPLSMPLKRKWIVSWSHFFNVPNVPQQPQPSFRIGPRFNDYLDEEHLFPAIDETGQLGLEYRDLMSAAFVGLWSVNSLIDEIRSRQPSLIANCRLLNDRGYRVERLRAWLERDRGELTEADINTLANDPPLPFFVLFEAAMSPDDPAKRGKTLGVLGSIIVAEVIFGAMREDALPAATASGGLRGALSRLSSQIYSSDHLEFVPEIETMGDLVTFIADIAHLKDADPTFL
jgi:hypothetical protein